MAKERGVKLGGARPQANKRHQVLKDQADDQARKVLDTILAHRHANRTYAQIAEELNRLAVPTARGGKWHNSTVQNYAKRFA